MVSIVPSDYTDIQKLAQRIPEHPSDILVQRYEANSYSNQSVRWSITANSPNSLLDSEVYLYARIKLDIRNSSVAGNPLAVTHSKLREQTSQKRDYNVLKIAAKPDQTYWDTPVTIGAHKNLGFCQRQVSGFWNAVDSLTVELNSSTSVSVRPSDWIWATDEFLVTDGDDWAGFPDSGCGGRFIGRSFGVQDSPDFGGFTVPNHITANNDPAAVAGVPSIVPAKAAGNGTNVVGGGSAAAYAIRTDLGNIQVAGDSAGWRPEFRVYEVDRNMADRCHRFQQSIIGCAKNTKGQYSAEPEFLLVTRLPARPFSYYRANFGSGRRSYLPYCQKMSIQLNFKPQGEAIRNWFQCTAVPHCGSANGQIMNCGFGTVLSGTSGVVVADVPRVTGTNLGVIGASRGVIDVRSQVMGSSLPANKSSWSFATKPYLVMKWIQPKDNFRLQSAYTISLPRYVVHKIETTLGGVDEHFRGKVQGAELRFSSLQLSVLPKMFLLVCRPDDGSGDYSKEIHGNATGNDNRAAAAGFFLRGGRIDCSYANTFDCLVDPDGADFQNDVEDEFPGYGTTSTALQFTINNKSGLTASYSARDLYRLSKKNLGFKFSFNTWIKDKCIIALSPQDLPADKLAYSYNPTTLSIVGRWKKNQFHNLKNQKHTLSLILMYEDSLTLSSGSASSQALVMPNRSGAGSTGRGISTADDLARR